MSDDCRTRICKNGCMYPQHCPHEPQSDAHFEEVKALLAELTEWKLAAWKLGLYMAGTDVSTPAKWASAQLSAYERLKVPPFTNAMTACGDCDPCLGGRPDQCAVMAKGTPNIGGWEQGCGFNSKLP